MSAALVELSGGPNGKTCTIKESRDIENYTKDVFSDTDPISKAMYCIRFYDIVYVA